MVELEKCGNSLADLHNARGFESKLNCLCTLTFGKANTPLLTCHPVHFEVKNTHFYLIFLVLLFSFCFFITFI